MDNFKFPPVSKELLAELERRFPDRLPDSPQEMLDQIRHKQGQVSVIRFLRTQFDLQNNTILEKL